jgi:hypothetical protein
LAAPDVKKKTWENNLNARFFSFHLNYIFPFNKFPSFKYGFFFSTSSKPINLPEQKNTLLNQISRRPCASPKKWQGREGGAYNKSFKKKNKNKKNTSHIFFSRQDQTLETPS